MVGGSVVGLTLLDISRCYKRTNVAVAAGGGVTWLRALNLCD